MFWLVACTKLIRNVTALQCVKRGQICLNNPVDEILPELARPQITQAVVSSDDGGAASQGFSLVSAKSTITLRQLLTHTSGLGYDFVYLELMAWRASRGEEPLSLSGQLVKAYSTPLLFEPGEGWAYGGGINVSPEDPSLA
jgi:CubicO group peptidase (beta-lactamase class C family)